MASKIHRRTPSNDGTVETILSSLAPSRSSSNSSSTSNSSMEEQQRDIESSSSSSDNHNTKPLLPTRGRSAAVVAGSGAPTPTPAALETTDKKISGSAMKAITACLNYSFCSVSMILVNKSLASRYVDRSICRNVCVRVRSSERAKGGRNEERKESNVSHPFVLYFLICYQLTNHIYIYIYIYTATII